MARLIAIFGAAFLVGGVTHAQRLPAQASAAVTGGRFGDLRDLVLAEEREPAPLPVRRGPRFPENAKYDRIEAVIPIAFVVDTLGTIEPRSITFLGSTVAPLEFRESLCDFLVSRARFKPLMRDGRSRRAFVLQPFSFSLQAKSPFDATAIKTQQREAVRRAGWDSVATMLEKQPHCQ